LALLIHLVLSFFCPCDQSANYANHQPTQYELLQNLQFGG
jgi:hypothetical protein